MRCNINLLALFVVSILVQIPFILSLLRFAPLNPLNVKIVRMPKVYNQTLTENSQSLSSWPSGRSKELFFRRILKIKEGCEFVFPMDRWKALQDSGLFRNLSAKSVARNNSEFVQLYINGIENPSISFSPEISFGTNMKNPEIAGGVSRLFYLMVLSL